MKPNVAGGEPYPIDPVSQLGQLRDITFPEGVKLYAERHYTEALVRFVEVLEQLKLSASIISEKWMQEAEYYTYKAWLMSPESIRRTVKLPMSFFDLESDVQRNRVAPGWLVVWVYTHFGRFGVRTYDAIERLRTKR